MNPQLPLFFGSALCFGYYAGYTWRDQNEPEPHYDFLVNFIAPISFILLGLAAFLL